MEVEIEHVQLDFIKEIDNNVCSLRVESNILCFALKSGFLFLIDLDKPSEVFKCQVPLVTASNNSEKLIGMWMNPSGKKLFIKTNFAKYYLCDVDKIKQQDANQGKLSSKVGGIYLVRKLIKKSCDVRIVSWYDEDNFLGGTADGNVLLVNTTDKDGKAKNDADVTSIYQSQSPIDGILLNKDGNFIVASGSKIMYWKKVDVTKGSSVSDIPTEIEEFERLNKDTGRKFDSYDNSFAWITQTGVVFGNVTDDAKVLGDAKLLLSVELPESKYTIRDIVLSQFHIIIVRGWTITIVNQLTNAVVFEESIWNQNGEKMLGLTADHSQDPPTFWCYTTAHIYEIILHQESQAVWKLLCDQKDFKTALGLKGLLKWEKEILYYHQGCYLLDDKNKFVEAAQSFGLSSSSSIGSIALRLMKYDNSATALQTYLTTRLEHIDIKNQVPRILLSSWIVWNYMKQLNDVDKSLSAERHPDGLQKSNEEKEKITQAFRAFISTHVDSLDKEIVYQVIAEQNRKQELLYFASLISDFDYVLSYWIRQENWYEALRVLLSMQDPESVYKYASVLLVNSPESTIHTWMKIPGVKAIELIPSLLTYFTNYQKMTQLLTEHSENFSLTYLLWCIEEDDLEDSILYNTALYMMITPYDFGDNDEVNQLKIIQFLDKYSDKCDKDFILRLSIRFHKVKVSIYLYTQLRLYEDAVILALDNNMIESARLVVNDRNLENNFKLRRILWLKIAKAMLYNESTAIDVKHAIRSIISESNNTLEIRDLLPLFDKFTTIANIKDELIRSLEKHGQSMSQISEQIRHSLKVKKDIQTDIEAFHDRFVALEPGSSCACCQKVLQTRKFLVFPCGHSFHTDCLIKAILNSKDYILKSKIENFQRRLSKDRNSVKSEELDAIVSTKCVLCSDVNINSIDEPIEIDEENAAKWSI